MSKIKQTTVCVMTGMIEVLQDFAASCELDEDAENAYIAIEALSKIVGDETV